MIFLSAAAGILMYELVHFDFDPPRVPAVAGMRHILRILKQGSQGKIKWQALRFALPELVSLGSVLVRSHGCRHEQPPGSYRR
jgi:hypothetical protein